MNQDLTWIKDRLVRLDGPKMLQVLKDGSLSRTSI
jgi:hypothetical protein